MNMQWIGIGAALCSAAAWAIGSILYKKLGDHLQSDALNLTRSAANLTFLCVPLLLTGSLSVDTGTFVLLGVSGLLGISLGDTLFFEAIKRSGPHLTVLLSLLGQVLTVLLAGFFLHETLTIRIMLGVVLTLGGLAVVLSFRRSSLTGPDHASGLVYALLSVLSMSASVIITKIGLSEVSALQAIFIRILWGTAGLLIWIFLNRRIGISLAPFREAAFRQKFLFMVIVTLFGGFWLSHVALKYADVSIANTLNATVPLFVLPLAAIFLKEKISQSAVFGTVITVIGVIVLITAR